MSEKNQLTYSTYHAVAIYRDWAERGKHRPLAAARYWLQYGIGEAGCDHAYLRAWLDRWWSRLPADEQRRLDAWMDSVHRSLEVSAMRYAAAQREREARIERAKAQLAQEDSILSEQPQ